MNRQAARSSGTKGFTLIEVLAAVLLTGMVIGAAVALYINLANATNIATERTREARHAVAILDRVARDVESAFLLVKPEDVDPLDHPWIFLAEARGDFGGADHLKFATRNHRPSRTDAHASDVGVVAYALVPGANEEGLLLLRSTSSRLPENLDRRFPADDDEGTLVLADFVRSFSVRFMNDSGEWLDEWDSSQIEQSGAIPRAVDVSVSLLGSGGFIEDEEEPELYSRRVNLPVRPVPIGEIIADSIAFAAVARETLASDCVPPACNDRTDEVIGVIPKRTDCKMSMVECFDLPKNSNLIRAQLGEDEFRECRNAMIAHPLCVEDRGAAYMCDVPVKCWR